MNKEKIIKYLNENELDVQRAHAFLFICDLAYSAYADSYKLHKVDFSPIFCHLSYLSHQPHYQFINKKIIDRLGEKIYLNYIKNNISIDRLIDEHKAINENIANLWKRYKQEKNISKKKTLAYYKKLIANAHKWWQYASIGEEKGHVIEKINNNLAKRHGINLDKAREYTAVLAHPRERSVFSLERENFYDIALAIGKDKSLKEKLLMKSYEAVLENKNIKKKIEGYINNFFWIKTDFCYLVSITPKSLLKEIEKELKTHSIKKIRIEKDAFALTLNNLEKSKKEILKKLKLKKDDLKDIYFAQRIIYWVDLRKMGMLKHMFYLWNFLEDLSKSINMSYEDISMHTPEEVGELIMIGKSKGNKILSARRRGTFLVFEKNKKIKIIYGKTAEAILKKATETRETNLKGMVASRGGVKVIKGRVKVVMNIKKDKFNKGDILVTSMTRPEYVPLMRTARAVITDEGGIACHAAIVSRELNKPCIIGVKIAAKLLRDGDLVEMNLENGKINIIK